MSKDNTQRDINRVNLRLHGIYYEPDVYEVDKVFTQSTSPALPDHVDAVREALLSFESTVPEEWEEDLREEFAEYGRADIGPAWTHHPQSSTFIRGKHYERSAQERSPEWKTAHENLKRSEEIAKHAREQLKGLEAEWNYFWRSEIFQKFGNEARKQPGFSPTLDIWSLYESVIWNEFENLMKPNALSKYRTQPKPDLTYAFPIQDLPHRSLKGFARDEFSQALSLQVLGKLVQQGVSCAPTTGLRKWTNMPNKTGMSSSDKSCFPWAVVEMKRHATISDASEERCYCQAANAAAAALELQAQLFDKLGDDASSQPPPVIAFTCIGPLVKVWLAYQDRSDASGLLKQRMVCIWSTSVLLTWGVASLRAIIMNMHTWASRLLKPKIQACVSQCSRRLRPFTHSNSQAPSSQTPPASIFSSPQINTPSSSPFQLNRSGGVPLPNTPRIDIPKGPQSLFNDPETNTSGNNQISSSRKIASPHSKGSGAYISSKSRLLESQSSPTAVVSSLWINATSSSQSSSGQKPPASLFSNSQINTSSFSKLTFGATGRETVFNASTDSAINKTCDRLTVRGIDDFKKHSRVSEPGEQPASPKETDRARADVDDLTKAFESSCLGDPFHVHGHRIPASLNHRCGCWKVGEPKDIGYSKALPSLRVTQSYIGSAGRASSSDEARSECRKETYNFISESGKRSDSEPDSSARLDGDPEVSDHDPEDKSTDEAGSDSDFDNDSEAGTDPVYDESTAGFSATSNRPNNGTADTPFLAFSEKNGTSDTTIQQYQTITFQSPYQNYSLEELRVTDYDQGRRYVNTIAQRGASVQRVESDKDSDFGNDSDLDNHSHPSNDPYSDIDYPNSEPDNDSDIWARKNAINALVSWPLSGERRIDFQTLKRIISGLKGWERLEIYKIAWCFRNPNGTYSVPLDLVLRRLNEFLEPEDRIS